MSAALAIDDLETWRTQLGLMPVPLFGQPQERRHVLLNGGKGNFCLDLTGEADTGAERDRAWSSDVGHYVTVDRTHVRVWRWDAPAPEVYKRSLVADNIVRFQDYLEERQPARAASVVGHFMSIYRQVRTLLGEHVDGPGALQAFLYLLASADKAPGPSTVDCIDWSRLPRARELALALPADQAERLREDMVSGRPGDRLKPIIPLVLRHASGRLFQEAHYLVELDPQLSMFGASEAKAVAKDSSLGAFFTPSPLVRTVVEEALKTGPLPSDVVVHDPACGSGEFLREALRQLQLSGHTGRIKLVGWDVSSAALAMAQFALDWERSRTALDVEVVLVEQDALAVASWDVGASLTLMNPPFISWQGMSGEQKRQVEARLGDLASKRPDYASAFFYSAVMALADNGIIGSVLPASLLDGESYVALRQALAQHLRPHLLARLGSHTVFADAVVDAGLYVGARGQSERPTLAVWSNHKADSSARALRRLRSISPAEIAAGGVDGGEFSIYPAPQLGIDGSSWAPRPLAAHALLEAVRGLPKVADLFDVSQGTITGLNDVFLVSRDYVEGLPKGERKYFRPAVINSSIVGGALNDRTYVFYPHGEKLECVDEEDLRKRVPTYAKDRLLPNKAALRKRSRIKADQWWVLSLPRTKIDTKGPKLLSTYFGGPGSFAWDADGRFIPVQGYAWTPRQDEVLGLEPAYLALLNHPVIMELLLSGVSNNLSGGQWNLSERYVKNLPLPSLAPEAELTQALRVIGETLARSKPVDFERWNLAVRAAYGLAPL